MSLADDLAYTSASELAALIRERQLSPLEAVDAFAERIEARNPSLNALVYLGLRRRARSGACGRAGVDERRGRSGSLHGVPAAIKDLFDFKPGWPATFGGIPALRDFRLDIDCASPSGPRRRARSSSARATARSWASGASATTRSSGRAATRSTRAATPAGPRAAARPRWPTAC